MIQRVILMPHDPRWAEEFTREAEAVTRVMGNWLVVVHHIGSTAIPGIRAKPVIDMLAVVTDVVLADEHSSRFQALGYESLGEFGIPGRRYFRKDDAAGIRTHQIHAFQVGSPQIERHLAFRDFMRAHREEAAMYQSLKQRLADLHPTDSKAYTDGKSEFIREIDAKAAVWRSGAVPGDRV